MDAAAAGLNIRATPAVATPAQSAQRQQASGATAAGATAIAGGATGGGGDVTSSSSRRPGSGFTSKRSRPWPLLTAQQLADDTPSRRAGIPAKRERAFYRNLYSLVKEGGQALALAQQTTTTALLFGFRYFALRSFSKSDRFVVGAAALFLAAKARDELRPLDAVVTACLKVREAQGGGGKKKGSAAAGAEGSGSVAASPMYTPTPTPGQGGGSASASALPSPASRTAAAIAAASLGGPSTLTAQLADKAYMGSLKEAVLTAERALLYVLGFELDLELPHEALMASLALLRKSEDPAVAEFWADPKHTQVALSFINDSFRTSLCLMHDWAHVGVGALVAVVDKLGGPAPVVSLAGGSWGGSRSGGGSAGTTGSRGSRPRFFWELVPSCSDMTPELLDDVVRIISGMYEQAPPAAPAPAGAAAGAAAAGSRKRRTGEGGEGDGGDAGGGGGGGGEGAKRVKTEQGAGPSAAAAAAAVAAPPVVDATNVVKQGRQGQLTAIEKKRRRRKQTRRRRQRFFASFSLRPSPIKN
jgi:hypothetical protein